MTPDKVYFGGAAKDHGRRTTHGSVRVVVERRRGPRWTLGPQDLLPLGETPNEDPVEGPVVGTRSSLRPHHDSSLDFPYHWTVRLVTESFTPGVRSSLS